MEVRLILEVRLIFEVRLILEVALEQCDPMLYNWFSLAKLNFIYVWKIRDTYISVV